MQSTVSQFRHHLFRDISRDSQAGSDVDARSLGLVLNDPDGYLRLKQFYFGADEAVIGRASSTGYSGRLRDDAYFTFVLQGEGRYRVQISGQDYFMSPGRLLVFRPNERHTQVTVGRTGTREVTTLQLPIARMKELAAAMETSADRAIPRDGMALSGAIGETLACTLPLLADALLTRTAPARCASTASCATSMLGMRPLM